MSDAPTQAAARPPGCDAVLALSDGTLFWGRGVGAKGASVGEVCFNTSMTGYQEILTDPSYAGQIITFTFPHIGNVGVNIEDIETATPAARGVVLRTDPTNPSSWRALQPLGDWLRSMGLVGITGIDTRRLTRRIRDLGPPKGCLAYDPEGRLDVAALVARARDWPGLEGMDLAKEVSCRQTYSWEETEWRLGKGYGRQTAPKRHVVAIDYGAKRNILRLLAEHGCRVTVVPATATAETSCGTSPMASSSRTAPAIPQRPAATRCPSCESSSAPASRSSGSASGTRSWRSRSAAARARCRSATAAPTTR